MCGLESVRSDGHNDHMKRKPLKLPPNTVGVAAAKRDLTALIDQVLKSGKPVTIARRGSAVVQLVPIAENLGIRWRKEFTIPESSGFWAEMRRIEKERKTRPARGTPQF